MRLCPGALIDRSLRSAMSSVPQYQRSNVINQRRTVCSSWCLPNTSRAFTDTSGACTDAIRCTAAHPAVHCPQDQGGCPARQASRTRSLVSKDAIHSRGAKLYCHQQCSVGVGAQVNAKNCSVTAVVTHDPTDPHRVPRGWYRCMRAVQS